MQLNELEKMRESQNIVGARPKISRVVQVLQNKFFHLGDQALLYDSKFKNFKGKFCTRWLGPYEVARVFENSSLRVNTINDDKNYFVVNDHQFKIYHKPLSHDQFLQDVRKDT